MNMLRSDNTVSYECGAPWAQKGLKKVLLAKPVIPKSWHQHDVQKRQKFMKWVSVQLYSYCRRALKLRYVIYSAYHLIFLQPNLYAQLTR